MNSFSRVKFLSCSVKGLWVRCSQGIGQCQKRPSPLPSLRCTSPPFLPICSAPWLRTPIHSIPHGRPSASSFTSCPTYSLHRGVVMVTSKTTRGTSSTTKNRRQQKNLEDSRPGMATWRGCPGTMQEDGSFLIAIRSGQRRNPWASLCGCRARRGRSCHEAEVAEGGGTRERSF